MGGDPINGSDPTGLDTVDDPCKESGGDIIVCGITNLGGESGPLLHNSFADDNCNPSSGCRIYSADYGSRLPSGFAPLVEPPDASDQDIVVNGVRSRPAGPNRTTVFWGGKCLISPNVIKMFGNSAYEAEVQAMARSSMNSRPNPIEYGFITDKITGKIGPLFTSGLPGRILYKIMWALMISRSIRMVFIQPGS